MNENETGGRQVAVTQREDFGGMQMQSTGVESASTAMAAQSKALVEARYIMAIKRPRDWDDVRIRVMKECRRPNFAKNPSAYYRKPIGKGVEGLGIRFVEMALRNQGNVLVESAMIFEDDMKEVHRVTVTDLEANVTFPSDVVVGKTIERSKPMDDGTFISWRLNSWGKKAYTIPAGDDEMLNKRAALISKAMRTVGLRIIPGDIQDEAEAIIKSVREDEAAKDPDAERKSIADAFASLNIKPSDLKLYLGHELDICSPKELVELRGLFGAVKGGDATWSEIMDSRKSAEDGSTSAPTPAPGPQRKGKPKADAQEQANKDQSSTAAPTGAPVAATPAPAATPASTGTPNASAQVTAVDPTLASEGEKAWILKRAAEAGVSIGAICQEAGLERENLDGLTRDGFVALQGVLQGN